MGFSRQEYWSGLPFPSPGDRTRVSRIGGRCFNLWATREAHNDPSKPGTFLLSCHRNRGEMLSSSSSVKYCLTTWVPSTTVGTSGFLFPSQESLLSPLFCLPLKSLLLSFVSPSSTSSLISLTGSGCRKINSEREVSYKRLLLALSP